MFRAPLQFAPLFVFLASGSLTFAAGKNIAVIDDSSGTAQFRCQFLIDHGYTCTVFPKEGPTGPLDPFDVVVDLSFN